jgi:hypothetical protein
VVRPQDSASKDERTTSSRRSPSTRETALVCTDAATAAAVSLTSPAIRARIQQLTSPIVFRMIEHINAGQQFNLPTVIGGPPPKLGS